MASNKCIDVLYDVLTVVISIADIVTDVIVCVSFYTNQRITFFAISVTILIIAQLAYAVLFIWRFNAESKHRHICSLMLLFLCLLPFGTLVSFIVYLTDDPDSSFSQKFAEWTGYDVKHTLKRNRLKKSDGKMQQWIIQSE